jgi:uncharacterized protein YejL (UPF0352 family)
MKFLQIFSRSVSVFVFGENKKKKTVKRRRSNWYIYLISFATTFALLCLLVLAFQDVLFPDGSNRAHNNWGHGFIPSEELDTTVLFMLSDAQGSVPTMYMLANYRPADEVIVIVPLNADTRITVPGRNAKIGTLPDIYREGGAIMVKEGLEETLGIECEYFVVFDRSSFTSFMADLGDVTVRIPFDFSGGVISLKAGEHKLTGGDLFIYMTRANFPQAGVNYNLVIMGSVVSSIINTNARNLDTETIQSAFLRILNNSTTNMTQAVFREYQQALLHTSRNTFNPAGYYLPPGSYEGGMFVLNDTAIAEIQRRFNQSGRS